MISHTNGLHNYVTVVYLKNIMNTRNIFLITGLVVFGVVGSILIIANKSASRNNQDNQGGQTLLLTDTAQLAQRFGLPQGPSSTVAPMVTISSNPAFVEYSGTPAVISWKSTNATNCVDGEGKTVRPNGSISITPRENYTMEITCTNSEGKAHGAVTVAVTKSPTISLYSYPDKVELGEKSLVSWDTINTTKCVDGAGKTLSLSGSFSVAPQKPYTFSMSCTGQYGTIKKSTSIAIIPKKTAVATVTKTDATTGTTVAVKTTTTTTPKATALAGNSNVRMSSVPPFVEYNSPSTISWNTLNVTNCVGISPTGLVMLDKNTGEELLLLNPGNSIPLADNGAVSIKVLEGQATATLTVRCDKPDGTQTEWSTTVRSKPNMCASFGRPQITWFPKKPTAVESGSPALVEWNARCATTCFATVEPTGDLITYPDTTKIIDYVDDGQGGQTYWEYTPTNSLPNLRVNPRGGVRVYPTAPGATVTLKCTNLASDPPYSNTESMTVPTIVHPSCSGWLSCNLGIVADVLIFMSPLSPTLFYDPTGGEVQSSVQGQMPGSQQ